MEEEKEKQMNVDVVDIPEEQAENEQRAEERTAENKNTIKDEASLFENNEAEKFRSYWLDIQSRFVDDPSNSVKDADELVASVIQSITKRFADKRIGLEKQWNNGDRASTEDLRLALKRYRSFFNRLLTLES